MSAVNQVSVKAMMSYAEVLAATANYLGRSKFRRLLVLKTKQLREFCSQF